MPHEKIYMTNLTVANMKYKILSIILFFFIVSCNKEEAEISDTKFKLSETMSKGMELTSVSMETVESELTLTGKISFNEDKVARVFPLAGGFVRDLNVELGDHVRKGQVMAIIRSPSHERDQLLNRRFWLLKKMPKSQLSYTKAEISRKLNSLALRKTSKMQRAN
jgi:multidrug efflux pump subunit AcrA (membrane-fusion protein)